MSGEVTVHEAAGLAGYAGGDGQRRMIALADEFRALCADRQKRGRPWLVRIGPGQHLTIEAWQYLGQRAGITARTAELHEIRHPVTGDYEGAMATAEVVEVNTGNLLGRAEQVCYADEVVKKKGGGTYRRWIDDEGKPSRHAIVGMAQTRAQSRALASVLRFLAELSGAEGTPAEEMDGVRTGATDKPPVKPPQRKPKKKPNGNGNGDNVVEGYVEDIDMRSGQKQDGTEWTRYGISVAGQTCGSFSSTDAEVAYAAQAAGTPVRITWRQKGEYQNIVAIAHVDSPDVP